MTEEPTTISTWTETVRDMFQIHDSCLVTVNWYSLSPHSSSKIGWIDPMCWIWLIKVNVLLEHLESWYGWGMVESIGDLLTYWQLLTEAGQNLFEGTSQCSLDQIIKSFLKEGWLKTLKKLKQIIATLNRHWMVFSLEMGQKKKFWIFLCEYIYFSGSSQRAVKITLLGRRKQGACKEHFMCIMCV